MTPEQALDLLVQAADLAPLPGPQRRQWEEAARLIHKTLKEAAPCDSSPKDSSPSS